MYKAIILLLLATSLVTAASNVCYSKCPAGTYSQSGTNQQECTKCSSGQFSYQGDTSCTPCDAGTYSDVEGTQKCTPCPLGKFTSGSGANKLADCSQTVSKCPAGKWSETGYNNLSGNLCFECYGNSISSEGATVCTKCTPPSSSNNLKTECSGPKLSQCEPGQFSLSGYNGLYEQACFSCELGSISASKGATSCTKCSTGQWPNSDRTSCVSVPQCPAGKFSTTGYAQDQSSGCSPCPKGTYSTNPGATTCTPCPTGKWTSKDGNTAVSDCDITGLTLCSAGSFSQSGYNIAISDPCIQCEVGFYSAEGARSCSYCKSGTIASNKGASSCTPCQAGFWSNSQRTACDVTTRLCPAGYQSPNGYDTNSKCKGCLQCEANTYSTVPGSTSCTACSNNRTAPKGSTAVTACACPESSSGPNDGTSECTSFSILIKFSLIFFAFVIIF